MSSEKRHFPIALLRVPPFLRVGAVAAFVAALLISRAAAQTIYASDFDSFTVGQTQPFPGDSGQDGWYRELAEGGAYGEVQQSIAVSGNAMHEFTSRTTPPNTQTIDQRFLGFWDISQVSTMTLSYDFYSHTSDLSAVNTYYGGVSTHGGPHPGFGIIGAGFSSGNGAVKSDIGVNAALSYFDPTGGADGLGNNGLMPLSVGQRLAWDVWHNVSVTIDRSANRYVALTVDGATQDLTAYQLPRSYFNGDWLLGNRLQSIASEVIPTEWDGIQTEDDFYMDNLSLTAAGAVLTDGSGIDQGAPVLPIPIEGGGFLFQNVAGGLWYDPPMANGYVFATTDGSRFTHILSFPSGFASPFTVLVGNVLLGQFSAGQSVNFNDFFAGGVSSFTISGINPLVDGANPTAFPIQLAFDAQNVSFTMTPINAAAAPEPGTALLLCPVVAALSARRWRAGRQQQERKER